MELDTRETRLKKVALTGRRAEIYKGLIQKKTASQIMLELKIGYPEFKNQLTILRRSGLKV